LYLPAGVRVRYYVDTTKDEAHLLQGNSTEAALIIRFQDAQLYKAYHRRFLDTGVRLFGAVGHQFGKQNSFLNEGMLLLLFPDCLGSGRQHGHQDTFAR